MKRNYLFRTVLSVFFILISCVSFAQVTSDDPICKKLETFYKEYHRLMMSEEPDIYPNEIIKLTKKNCTKEFAECIENELLNRAGADFVAYEHIDNMYLSTLSISKANGYYKVSFDADIPDSSGNKKNKEVILAVYLKDGLVDDVKELQGW